MRTQSIVTLASSLAVLLSFVVIVNLVSSSSLTAQPSAISIQELDNDSDLPQENEFLEENEFVRDTEEQEEDRDQFEQELEEDEFDDEDMDEFQEEEELVEEDEGENEFHELGGEYVGLEFDRLNIETNLSRIEFMKGLTEIAGDPDATACYAIMHLGEYMDAEESVELLESLLLSSKVSIPTRNLIRMKLAEIHTQMDQTEKAKGMLEALILGK
ncbi:MAG: hypothetical protein AAFN77_08600 [Planctomycetota bacterium]